MAKLMRFAAAALLLSTLDLSTPASAAARKSITSLTASEIRSLRRGVAQMKAWNSAPKDSANYRRSWEYWANMHQYFGIGCEDPVGLSVTPGMGGLTEQVQTTADQGLTWCKCKHHDLQFLTWHRMYLYYFEQVLRAAAGDPNLALPYWDYQADGHLPSIYRQPQYFTALGPRPNPLFVANRAAPLNDGSAALLSGDTSTAGAMLQMDYASFSDFLESTPHGAVHCAVSSGGCWSGYMGRVPSAANDPIFWAHHASIDKFYECWLAVDRRHRLPTDPAILNATFSFPDGSGTIVTRRTEDMLTTGQLGYHYTPLCAGTIPHFEPIAHERPPWHIPVIGPWRIAGGRRNAIPLRISADTKAQLRRLSAGAEQRPAILRLTGIRFNRPPHALYKVSVRYSSGALRLLGLLSFFGAGDAVREREHQHASSQPLVLPSVRTLTDATELVFEPTMGLTDRRDSQRAARLDAGTEISFTGAVVESR